MSISKLILTTSAWFIIVLLTVSPGLAEAPPVQPPPPVGPSDFVPGEILVKFQSHVSLSGIQGSLRTEGLQPLEVSLRSGLVRVQVTPGQETGTIDQLMGRGDVEFATYNYRVRALGAPDDPEFWQQWALQQASDRDIDAPEAWGIHTGGDYVTVAIIDTGVDIDHEDLQANIWINDDEAPGNSFDDDYNRYVDDVQGYDFYHNDSDPDDDNSHGTHVAGIAAARGNNGQGIAGVSWQAKIMPLKVLDAGGNGTTDKVVEAIYYAADNGAQIINMSFGGDCLGGWPHVEEAVNYAALKGVLLVAAAGNNHLSSLLCPAALDHVMAVGATNANDERAYYSNYGPGLDVVAPGGDWSNRIYSTIPGTYGYKHGTSMATPYVAGLAALIRSLAPSLTSNQVRDIIQTTADDLGPAGWDQDFGYGRINAWQALETMSLQTSPAQLTLFIDDDSGPVWDKLQVTTINPDAITWTAGISPPVEWLALSPPISGVVSTASSPVAVTLVATRPLTYNTYATTVIITGTTASGETVGPRTTEVRLHYVPEVYELRLPLIIKN